MTGWIFLLAVLFVVLILISVIIVRRTRHYEEKRLRDVLSEEMQLVLRNERTENLQKKRHFEKILKDADEAHLPESAKHQQD